MADELRFTLFNKRAHTFLIIHAVVDGATHSLNTFELVGIHGVGFAKHAQLFLNDRDRQRRFLGDVVRHLQGKIFQFVGVHHVIENTDRQRALGALLDGYETVRERFLGSVYNTYANPAEWDEKAKDLASRFIKNFAKYEGNEAGKALVAAGPQL